jgi:hypothetical protein
MILELFFVEVAILQEVWALKHSHLTAGDGVECWCSILVWDSLKEGVDHFVGIEILRSRSLPIDIHLVSIRRVLWNLTWFGHFKL